jgi:diheme cytochrome c
MRHPRGSTRPALLAAVVLAAGVAITGCSRDRLPEQDSYAGQLYASRCGQCHAAYNPHGMTAAMWQTQVDAMQGKMQQAGIAPLSDEQRATILGYLQRNAGTQ